MNDTGHTAVVEADVIVVGAGPGGATTAAWLADQGLAVTLLEKTTFPREKVCGDGLTPRTVKQLIRLGIDTSQAAGWQHNLGLRVYGGRTEPFVLPWPELADYPSYGLTRPRVAFDMMLADHAVARGAALVTGATVVAPILDETTGRIAGVTTEDRRVFRAPVVVAADGASSRLAVSMGVGTSRSRPMGVAVRGYFASPRNHDDYMESWLELWDGKPGASNLLPGYGWVFPMGDGTCNVGLGMLNSSSAFGKTNYRQLLWRWLAGIDPAWGFVPGNQVGPIGSAALPMAFRRQPLYHRGLLLVGDAGGMVNPFNGEGIAYAMEAGAMAAEAIGQAHYRGVGTASAERALQGYVSRVKHEWGGYYRLGTIFVKLIGDPRIMKLCTTYGLPRPTLMTLVMKLLANLYDRRDGDWMDKLISALTQVVPSV